MIPEAVPYKVMAGTVATPARKRKCWRHGGRPECAEPTAWLGYVGDDETPSRWACEVHKDDVEPRVRDLALSRTYERAYGTPSVDEAERLIGALGPELLDRIAWKPPTGLSYWERRRGGVMLFLADGATSFADRQIEFCRHRTERPAEPLWDVVWLDCEDLPYPLIPVVGDLRIADLRAVVEKLVDG